MSKPSPHSRSNSSESLIESSDDETSKEEKKSNSATVPVMKTKTASSIKQELNFTNISTTNSQRNSDICLGSKNEITTPLKITKEKAQWEKFTKNISQYGELKLTGLKSVEIQELAEWLSSAQTAKVISLRLQCEENAFVEMDYKAAIALAKVIQTNTVITSLSIIQSGVDDKTAKYFAEAIEANPKNKIESIELTENKLGDEGVKAFAKMLKLNTSVNYLNISKNLIGCEGAKALAETLKTNKTLYWLNLMSNNISNDGLKALAEVVKINTEIISICIACSHTNPDGMKFLKIINRQYFLNRQKSLITENIVGALDLLTQHPNPNDGNVTSIPDVNKIIAEKLFTLDKAEKLNTDEVRNDPDIVINKYT